MAVSSARSKVMCCYTVSSFDGEGARTSFLARPRVRLASIEVRQRPAFVRTSDASDEELLVRGAACAVTNSGTARFTCSLFSPAM
jgi:hypothetical protein